MWSGDLPSEEWRFGIFHSPVKLFISFGRISWPRRDRRPFDGGFLWACVRSMISGVSQDASCGSQTYKQIECCRVQIYQGRVKLERRSALLAIHDCCCIELAIGYHELVRSAECHHTWHQAGGRYGGEY